jgi:hypothetical protein
MAKLTIVLGVLGVGSVGTSSSSAHPQKANPTHTIKQNFNIDFIIFIIFMIKEINDDGGWSIQMPTGKRLKFQ